MKKTTKPNLRKFNERYAAYCAEFNCGTGAGGFQKGNKCSAGGGGSDSGASGKPIQLKATTEAAAKIEIAALSKKHPGKYITVVNTFGLFAIVKKYLNVFAPSDSVFPFYALNGKVKPFTKAQKIADQNATPTMS